MGDLTHLMQSRNGQTATATPRQPGRWLVWASYVLGALFCVLFVTGLALGSNGYKAAAEPVALVGIGCLLAGVCLYLVRDVSVDWDGVFYRVFYVGGFAAYVAVFLFYWLSVGLGWPLAFLASGVTVTPFGSLLLLLASFIRDAARSASERVHHQ